MLEVTARQIEARLRIENPWWQAPFQIAPLFRNMRRRGYFERFFELVKATDVRRAVVLMGPRRVGKTVMIYQAIQGLLDDGVPPDRLCYLSLEQPLYNKKSIDELFSHFLSIGDPDVSKLRFLFIDEIQYLKDWEIHLKSFVDTYPNVKCVVSGSAAAALRLKSVESGAGRFTDFLLPPLTFHEFIDLRGKSHLVTEEGGRYSTTDLIELNADFVRYINFGGYPEVGLSETIQSDMGRYVKNDIIEKVLLRDLPSLYGIYDIQELNSLFTTLAFNTSLEISLDSLAQKSGVAKATIKRYMEYLEAAFLIRIVHRIDKNAKRFKRANFFKVYLTHPSLRSAMFDIVEPESEEMGQMAETAVCAQWFHSTEPIYYARWEDGGEIDIVWLDHRQQPKQCVDVKWSDRFFDRPEDLKSLKTFCRANPKAISAVTTRTKFGRKSVGTTEVNFYPASLYCYIVGKNVVQDRAWSSQVIVPELKAPESQSDLPFD